MVFGMMGISFKTAPIEIREKLSFHEREIPDALHYILKKKNIQEAVLLSTCNRVELYVMMNEAKLTVLYEFVRDFINCQSTIDDFLYFMTDEDAIKHLCRVAAGLESMVIGEPQIFGQVKDAYAISQEHGGVKMVFEHLFPQVFSVVKKIRSRTEIGRNNVSVSYIAVMLAQKVFQNLSDKKIMIIGAGEMGELTVRNFISSGVRNIVVANRTFQKAVNLAERFNGVPIMLHELHEYIQKVDIIIGSIQAPSYVITYDTLNNMTKNRKRGQLFLIDIAVPRSFEPDIKSLKNVYLNNVDDLRALAESNAESRQQEIDKAIKIIESKLPKLTKYTQAYDFMPTMISIRMKAEQIKNDELEKLNNLGLSGQDRKAVETQVRSMVNKILYHSEVKFREYSTNGKHSV